MLWALEKNAEIYSKFLIRFRAVKEVTVPESEREENEWAKENDWEKRERVSERERVREKRELQRKREECDWVWEKIRARQSQIKSER